MPKAIILLFTFLIGAAVGGGALWFAARERFSAAPAAAHEDKAAGGEHGEANRATQNAAGETVVHFDKETQEHVGLQVEPLTAWAYQPSVAAYGVLQEDPSRTFTLRAPLAGTLRAAAEWPVMGQALAADAVVGYLEPRFTPAERIDLAARLSQARGDRAEAEAALQAARASYESKLELNARDKAVSDRVVEEARAKLEGAEARARAAARIVELIETAQQPAASSPARLALRTDQAGEVVQVGVQPDEAVEPGQVLLRVERFDALLAQVALPLGEPVDPNATSAEITTLGVTGTPLHGERIGFVAEPNSALARGPALLLRVMLAGQPLRPGAAIVAHLPQPGGPQQGIAIPRRAIVRTAGQPWVYVQTGDEEFTRRALAAALPVDERWFAARGFQPGERVVVAGAQMLLSEEQKATIEQEAAATE